MQNFRVRQYREDELSKLAKAVASLQIDPSIEKRNQLITRLVDVFSVNEAAVLLAKIHEKTSSVNKSQRFGLYPIEDWDAFRRMKKLEVSFWTADEIDFREDRNDFNELSSEEQYPLKMAFGFFAVGDGSIASMLAYRMILTADTLEKQCWYVVQLNNERVHAETYGKMIHSLITDPKERQEIFEAVERVKSIRKMNEFIERSTIHLDGQRQLYVYLALAEYVLFIPLFCIIFWYRAYRRGKLRRIIFSNEQIAKDEAAHADNGWENYNKLSKSEKYSDKEIWVIVDQVVQRISDFADEVFSDINLTELTPENIKQYVRYVADDLLDRMNHSKKYKVENPFVWMDFTNLVPKTNFYEGTVGEYSRFNVGESLKEAYQLCHGVEDEPSKKVNAYQQAQDIKF